MPDRFPNTLVDKLIMLEQNAGFKVGHRLMPPLATAVHDFRSIQVTAKTIGEFIGLHDFTFIIAAVKQDEKVGGHIDLSTGGRDVYIEIDDHLMQFPDAVAATLCHEVSHKWLEIHRIHSPIEIDNEILTDISCVFLGFGKVMLNGCSTTKITHESTGNGRRTITESMTTGYLDREQFAFIYRLVCEMRRIPSTEFLRGLNEDAIGAVQKCDSLYRQHYDPRFHGTDSRDELITSFNNRVVDLQKTMADLDKHVTYIRKSFLTTVENFLFTKHRTVGSLQQEVFAMTRDVELNPCMHFLRNIQMELQVRLLSDEVRSVLQDTAGLLQQSKTFGRLISTSKRLFPAPSPAMFNVVTCPNDGTKLRLPEDSGDIIATCPKCKHSFPYNTNVITFLEAPVLAKLSLWQRMRHSIKKRKASYKVLADSDASLHGNDDTM